MLSFEADWNMAANAMETDDVTHLPSNTLRRSSSAPNVSAAVINDHVPAFQPIQKSRERRFSTSQVAVNVGSPASRIAQLIKEASIDDISREIQGESEMLLVKDIHECFSLEDHDKNHDTDMHDRRNSFDEPCMAFPSSASSSPSPTRFNHKPVPIRNTRSLTPPGASPTRQTFIRRSMSPILNLRPSSLQTIKRKGSDGFEPGVSPAKRPRDETSSLTCSPEGPCETAHLQFDDDSNIHEEHHSSSASDSPLSSSITPMLFGSTHRPHLPVYRSRFTPPRSPLAGPSTTQGPSAPPRTIGNSPSCFTFAPVRD